jgi:4-hydroxybenzoate polyprenyltransferase
MASNDDQGSSAGGTLARASVGWGLICIAMTGVVLQDRTAPAEDFPLAVLGAVLVAGGLALHGMALNDLLDVRRDETRSPSRVRSWRGGPAHGALLATSALVLAMLGAGLLGGQAVLVLVALAAGLLFYNAMARFIPAIGVLVLGLLVAGVAVLPGWPPPVPWLPWSLFTIAVAIGLMVHLLAGKRPQPSSRALVGLAVEWIVVSVLLLTVPVTASLADAGNAVTWGLLWPAAAVVVLLVLLAARLRKINSGPRAADTILRMTGLWTGVFAASWCQCVGATGWAIGLLGATALVALMIIGLREFLSGDGDVVGWR